DANGILNVHAKDKATGRSQSIKITGSTGLSKDEVEKMTKEAEEHSAEDVAKKEKIEANNRADNMIYVAEKSLKDAGDKVSADIKKEIEEKISALKEILASGTKEDLESKTRDLSDSLQKIGQAMYQQQQKAQEPQKKSEEPDGEKKQKKDKKEDVQEGEVVS
ncbi:molecular chaperone DnaK, partial [Candidatus Gottesmanbacteria bacterium]|nr:molecular chaperone DnaK [Candidatus Gottesmanbacteria bacterium]